MRMKDRKKRKRRKRRRKKKRKKRRVMERMERMRVVGKKVERWRREGARIRLGRGKKGR